MDDPLGLLLAAVLLAAIAWVAARLAWLTRAGAAGAAILGLASVHAFGWAGLLALLAPFLAATLLGRLPGTAGPEGPRTLKQVSANGLVSLLGVAIAWAGWPVVGAAVFVGNLAALGADTIATEIGVRYGGTPRSVITGRALARGESGGATLAGTLASAAGACLAPAAFLAAGGLEWHAFLALAAAGFAAGLFDSALGAAFQRKGVCPACGAVVESATHCGMDVPPLPRRLRLLDNDAVNLANGILGAALSAFLIAV